MNPGKPFQNAFVAQTKEGKGGGGGGGLDTIKAQNRAGQTNSKSPVGCPIPCVPEGLCLCSAQYALHLMDGDPLHGPIENAGD